MPGLDLTSLNAQELRNVLEAARSRNQPELTQEVLSELQSRRSRPGGRVPWRVLAHEHAAPETPDVWWEDLRHDAVQPAERRSSKAPVLLALLAAAVVSAGAGWWLGPRLTSRPEPVAVQTLEAPLPVEASSTRAAPALPPIDPSVQTSAPAVNASTEPLAAPAAAPPPARVAKAEPSVRPPAKSKPLLATMSPVCRAKPTPADRVICAHPALAAQHQRMRDAYDRAIDAGADPRLVDGAQADWRNTRNAVTDPARLAKLYNQRIRELNDAARAATQQPPT